MPECLDVALLVSQLQLRSMHNRSGAILSFRLSFRLSPFHLLFPGSDLWHLAIPYVPNTSQVIGDLEPGLTYQFRVSANNAIGISEPSSPSVYVAIPSEFGELKDSFSPVVPSFPLQS